MYCNDNYLSHIVVCRVGKAKEGTGRYIGHKMRFYVSYNRCGRKYRRW